MEQAPAQAENQTQDATQQAAPPEGVQKRFDEMTAKLYSEREQTSKLQQQVTELAAQLAQQAMQLNRPQPAQVAPPPDPFAGIADQMDPRQVEAFRAALKQTEDGLKAQFAARQAELEMQASVYQIRSEAATLPGIPPQVAQEAEQLVMNWRRQGISQQVATAQDALNIALGKYQAGQLRKAAPVQQYQQQQAQAPYAPATLPPFAPPAPPALQRPANFEHLTPQQQNAYFEKAGVGDQPL